MDAASPDLTPTVIVIGLGNPILGDDGVGWRVAAQVAERLAAGRQAPVADLGEGPLRCGRVDVDCLAVGGLRLMEHLAGYAQAVIIDAVQTGAACGTVQVFPLSNLPDRALGHLGSPHDTTLQTALKAGRRIGVALPSEILIVGVEAGNVYEFTEELSPAVAAAIPQAVKLVLDHL